MTGTFVPSWYVPVRPSCSELAIASVVWGISLCLTAFALVRCGSHTYKQWKKYSRATLFVGFIWLETAASTLMGGIFYGYMQGQIPPSFWFYAGAVLLWAVQVQCIFQIILNRISLISDNTAFIARLKWACFVLVIVINISVMCIWVPAQLQISKRYVKINQVFDRIEKIILAVIDISLNVYFLYLVRLTIVGQALSRYVVLYRANITMVALSLAMDVLIIAMMSVVNNYLYVTNAVPNKTPSNLTTLPSYVFFHPLAYLVKLHIELSMSDLITKIAKQSTRDQRCLCTCHKGEIDWASNPSWKAPTIGRLSNWDPVHRWRARHHLNNLRGPRTLNDTSVSLPNETCNAKEHIREPGQVHQKTVLPSLWDMTPATWNSTESAETERNHKTPHGSSLNIEEIAASTDGDIERYVLDNGQGVGHHRHDFQSIP